MRKLKTIKAACLDQIPPRLMKDSANVISKPLADITNLSISQGCVPRDWKIARVIPIFKGGKTSEMDNYRPISILSTASKVMENAVHSQLRLFLKTHTILSPFECGFRKGHSTEFAAISLTDNIRQGMDQGLLTGSVFIRLS